MQCIVAIMRRMRRVSTSSCSSAVPRPPPLISLFCHARTTRGLKKKGKEKKKTYRQIFGVIRKSIHSFFLSSSLAPRIPSTMAKIKKKGLFSMQYFALLSSRLCLIPVLTLLRHLRPGQKLYHSYSGRAKASDFSAGFPSTMHLQGYVLYLQPEDRSLF